MKEKNFLIPKSKPRPKQNRSNATKAAGVAAVALTGGTAVQALRADKVEKQKREDKRQKKRDKQKQQRDTRINKDKVKLAQIREKELKKIDTSVLNNREKKQRQALIKQQQNIVKGLTKTSAKELAKQVGLRTIPFIGAFLTAVSSKPAGAGSAKFGPGSNEDEE